MGFVVKGTVLSRGIVRILSTTVAFGAILGVLLFAGACEAEPTPTPIPTATPVPPTPTATATPEPTPTPVPMSLAELEITETTTVREVVSAFSAEEQACIREAVGADAFNLIADAPVSSLEGGAEDFPIQCLSMESTVGFVVANLSAEAGGLSLETRSCITDIAIENPGVLGMGPPPESFGQVIAGAIRMQLCLTDEEAEAWAASQGMELPPPSVLECIEEQVGGEEAFLAMLTDEATSEEALFNLLMTAPGCMSEVPMATPTGG